MNILNIIVPTDKDLAHTPLLKFWVVSNENARVIYYAIMFLNTYALYCWFTQKKLLVCGILCATFIIRA